MAVARFTNPRPHVQVPAHQSHLLQRFYGSEWPQWHCRFHQYCQEQCCVGTFASVSVRSDLCGFFLVDQLYESLWNDSIWKSIAPCNVTVFKHFVPCRFMKLYRTYINPPKNSKTSGRMDLILLINYIFQLRCVVSSRFFLLGCRNGFGCTCRL